MKNLKKEHIALIVILIFAAFLRLYALGDAPLWIDESISAIASQNILEKGIPLLDSGLLYSRAYLFHYVQAFFMLFGENDFNLRLFSVIFGLLTIVLAYFIGKEYSKSGGLISALFFAVFYLEVFYSRQARFYQLFQLAFFLSIYLLYKSKENPKFIYLSLITLFITINTQIAGLVLVPFFIAHILIYNRKQWYLSLIPAIPVMYKLTNFLSIPMGHVGGIASYAERYSSYVSNIYYLLILTVPGVIWAFVKNKRLTLLMVLPPIFLLLGVFFVKLFALRYAYFFIFPIILYSSLLLSFLYEKYGKIMLLTIFILLIFPSNLIFPYTYVNIIKPIDGSYNDSTTPYLNYKDIPEYLLNEIKTTNRPIMTTFSPGVEWYIRKPTYVFPFSMTGIGNDTLSYNGKDVYSGAVIRTTKPNEEFYFIIDRFSESKLNQAQRQQVNNITENCVISYKNEDIKIYECF